MSLIVSEGGGKDFAPIAAGTYAAQQTWGKVSACAQNTKDYLLHKQDYLIYKRDFVYWEEVKRAKADRCRSCEYRKKVLEQEEAQP